MNRRDFLKLSVTGLLGTLFPRVGVQRIMGEKMPVGELLKKIANGLNAVNSNAITQREIEELRLWGNRIELQDAFVTGLQNGVSSVSASSVRVRDLNPLYLPTYICSVATEAAQSIQNNIWTQVTSFENAQVWETTKGASGGGKTPYFEWDYTNQRFKILKHGRRFMLYGHATWASSAAGGRSLTVDTYDEDEVYNGTFWIDARAGFSRSVQLGTRYPSHFLGGNGDVYYEMWVYQNSGGPLDLDVADFKVGVIE